MLLTLFLRKIKIYSNGVKSLMIIDPKYLHNEVKIFNQTSSLLLISFFNRKKTFLKPFSAIIFNTVFILEEYFILYASSPAN